MKYSLQPTGYKDSNYERPSSVWVCGKWHQGEPCRRGPDAHGGCQGHGECEPVKRGDRWFCTRPEIAGGPCNRGPLPDGRCGQPVSPCVPNRSHRALLRRVSWGITLLAISLLMIFIFGSWRLDFLSPGDLSSPHAVLKKCSLCHGAFEGGMVNWLAVAVGKTHWGRDSDLCLKCHPRVAQARWPHNLAPDVLATLQNKPPVSASVDQIHQSGQGYSAPTCSVCHREHTGGAKAPVIRDASLCNSCHQTPVAGFSIDHPNFIPPSAKGGAFLYFDHASHLKRHFQGKLQAHAPEKCSVCHQSQPTSGFMVHVGFKTACAACHVDQIRGDLRAGFKGFPVLSVPGIDTQMMKTQFLDVGQWPDRADGEMTPFMHVLLRDDAEFVKAWGVFGQKDLLNLENLSGEESKILPKILWSIKGLFGEFYNEGHTAWARRFYGAGGLPATGEVVGEINGGLAVDTLKLAVGTWFPNLDQELTLHGQGQNLPYHEDGAKPVLSPPVVVSTGGGKDGKIAAPPSDQGDGLLTDDSAGGLLDDAKETSPQNIKESLLDPEPGVRGGGEGQDATHKGTAVERPAPKRPLNDEEWSRGGGWYRVGYALYYRPGGNDDRFLRTWLDQLRSISGPMVEPLRALMSGKNAPGECGKCHINLLKAGIGGLGGNQPIDLSGSQGLDMKSLTRFSHKPHVNVLHNNCQDCHHLEATSTEEPPEKTDRPKTSGFKPMSRGTCVTCHTAAQAGEDCLQCHKYHARPR